MKVKKLMQKINKIDRSKQVLMVGGAVRDYLLNREPKDYDLATNININKISRKFKTIDIGNNKDFGIVVIDWYGTPIEVAQYRSDGKYEDNRHPDKVELINDFKTDSARRDFTINSFGMDIDGNIIDYHNGENDLKNKLIRTVGNPTRRFQEDALRMLRAIRFAAQLDFSIEKNTKNAIKRNSYLIKNVSQERITDEIKKIASTRNFSNALILLKMLNLLHLVLPLVNDYNKVFHNRIHHPEGNLFKHILACLNKANSNDYFINLSILYHDVGKLKTYKVENGMFRYKKHAKVGLDMIDNDIKDRMKFSNKLTDAIKYSIKNHMKMHHLDEMKHSKIQSLIENKNWEVLKEVGRADCLSRDDKQSREWWQENKKVITKVKNKMKENKKYKDIRKVVDGFTVMHLRKIEPGPKVGKIIKKTMDWIIDENINLNNTQKIYNYILEVKV